MLGRRTHSSYREDFQMRSEAEAPPPLTREAGGSAVSQRGIGGGSSVCRNPLILTPCSRNAAPWSRRPEWKKTSKMMFSLYIQPPASKAWWENDRKTPHEKNPQYKSMFWSMQVVKDLTVTRKPNVERRKSGEWSFLTEHFRRKTALGADELKMFTLSRS